MVRAILAGTKTQTRRVVKPQPAEGAHVETMRASLTRSGSKPVFAATWDVPSDDGSTISLCPYGHRGSRLWVREATRMRHLQNPITGEPTASECGEYVADGEPILDRSGFDFAWWYSRRACPSIHMPRWASRITLEVTGVRVERLRDISEADARAEGCPCYVCGRTMDGLSEDDCHCFHRMAGVSDYRLLWESINGPGSWDANPWVWVIAFRRLPAGD